MAQIKSPWQTSFDRVVSGGLGAVARVWFVGRRTPRPDADYPAQVRSVLLIRPEGLGDIILTLPAIAWLRRASPGVRIAMAVRPLFADFVRDIGIADETIALDYPKKSTLALDRLMPFFRQVIHLRRKYDVAFDFRGDPRNAMLGAWSARMVAGELAPGTDFLLSYGQKLQFDCSRAVQHLHLVRLGAPIAESETAVLAECRISANPAMVEAARRYTAGLSNFVILHPGASIPSNRWTVRQWQVLAQRLAQDGFELVFTGAGTEEVDLVAAILNQDLGGRLKVLNLAGKSTVSELAGVVSLARAVVSPDTGIAHVAHALGTPAVTLFGPGSEILNGYLNPKNRALCVTLPCRPCMAAQCPRTDFPRECMERISEDAVYEALHQAMAHAGPVRAPGSTREQSSVSGNVLPG
ncbi:MAG TPA: glycosyltransferase family 9 protein [Acidobacteriaceae bacterium]|nr:glycosyltransferase family 9 protein [Acidobacteriaceae bacterium]